MAGRIDADRRLAAIFALTAEVDWPMDQGQ